MLGLFGVTNYVLTPKDRAGLAEVRAGGAGRAREAQAALLIDFIADWCLPCKELEVQVFARPEVAELMPSFTLLRIDLSREERRHPPGAG